MYESFYGLEKRAFSILPDPEFLYFSRHHRSAYGMLQYGLLQQGGFVVITGEIGTGKTTLVRYLMGHLNSQVTTGLVHNTHRGFGAILEWVVSAFGIEAEAGDRVALYRTFSSFLQNENRSRRRALLIVDEAQNLNADALEELRTLSNLNASAQLLQIMLVGQPGLRDTLRQPDMVQFAQRVVVDYHLKALTQEETTTYIVHRLRVAGGKQPQLFQHRAMERVYQASKGVPRLINVLCESALVYGYASQKRSIDADLVEEVVRDRWQGVLPLATGDRTVSPRVAP